MLTPDERDALEATFDAYAAACARAYDTGLSHGTTSNTRIHAHCYRELRHRFGLSANLAVRAIARAAATLKAATAAEGLNGNITAASDTSPRAFFGAVDYDARILSIDAVTETASLSTTAGRLRNLRLVRHDGEPIEPEQKILRAKLTIAHNNVFMLTIVWHPAP